MTTNNTKKYFAIMVFPHEGNPYRNPLTLSEAHLLAKMARENKRIEVEVQDMDQHTYNLIFGKQ